MDDLHLRTVLISLLDATTRQHTSNYHGIDTSYAELRRICLLYTSDAADE